MAFKKNYVSAVVVALLMGIFGTVSGESSARRVSENSDIYSGNLFNVGMIIGLLAGIATVVILIVLVAKVFVGNLLKMGGYRFFILNQTAQPGIGTLLDGFRSGHYVNIVLTMFLRDLFTTLWSLLLVVPGIVKHYEYLMVPYIIAENPAMDYKEAFQISKQMMKRPVRSATYTSGMMPSGSPRHCVMMLRGMVASASSGNICPESMAS